MRLRMVGGGRRATGGLKVRMARRSLQRASAVLISLFSLPATSGSESKVDAWPFAGARQLVKHIADSLRACSSSLPPSACNLLAHFITSLNLLPIDAHGPLRFAFRDVPEALYSHGEASQPSAKGFPMDTTCLRKPSEADQLAWMVGKVIQGAQGRTAR
jgi:hypothetical protein